MRNRWTFRVDAPVVAKQRARLSTKRRGGKRVAYTPQATRSFEATVADRWQQTYPNHTPIDGPMHVTVRIDRDGFSMNIAKQTDSVRPVGIRGDIDNYLKSILDGLNGVAWTDDKLVESVSIVFEGPVRKQRGNRKPR